jgi:hypothetical protein
MKRLKGKVAIITDAGGDTASQVDGGASITRT